MVAEDSAKHLGETKMTEKWKYIVPLWRFCIKRNNTTFEKGFLKIEGTIGSEMHTEAALAKS